MKSVTLVAGLLAATVSLPSHGVEQSLALRTALLLGLTDPNDGPLRDVKRADLPTDLQGVPDPAVGNAISKALSAGVALTAASAAVSGLFAFDALFGEDRLDHPATQRHFIAYVPKSGADKEQAVSLLKSTLENAIAAAYRAQGYEFVATERHVKGLIGSATFRDVFVKGGQDCGIRFGCKLILNFEARSAEDVGNAPSFVPASAHGYYAWKNWTWGDKGTKGARASSVYLVAIDLDDPTRTIFGNPAPAISRETLRLASAQLPEWAFIYDPASESARYPAFLHRGEEKLFVEPLAADASTPQPGMPRSPRSAPQAQMPALSPGALVLVRDGAQLRGNPTAKGAVLRTLTAAAAVELATRMANGYGAWWSVKADGKAGWVAEEDITGANSRSAEGEDR